MRNDLSAEGKWTLRVCAVDGETVHYKLLITVRKEICFSFTTRLEVCEYSPEISTTYRELPVCIFLPVSVLF